MLECRVVIAILLLATLGGCGLKGPLYLPSDTAQEVSAQSTQTEEEKKKRASSGDAATGDATPAVPTDTSGAPSSTPPPTGN